MERLEVEKAFHPFIAGPYNRLVTEIMQETGTRINIPPPSVNRTEIVFTGEKEQLAQAVARIKKIYEEKVGQSLCAGVERSQGPARRLPVPGERAELCWTSPLSPTLTHCPGLGQPRGWTHCPEPVTSGVNCWLQSVTLRSETCPLIWGEELVSSAPPALLSVWAGLGFLGRAPAEALPGGWSSPSLSVATSCPQLPLPCPSLSHPMVLVLRRKRRQPSRWR